MPRLNHTQVTYYLDKRIWREAHGIAMKRKDAPPIVYYWWLGGDLGQAHQARLDLAVNQLDLMGVRKSEVA